MAYLNSGTFAMKTRMLLLLLLPIQVWAQRTITGTITNAATEPLVGATIIAPQSFASATADVNGRFKLTVTPQQNTLIVGYVGYKTDTVAITSDNITIVLKSLDELGIVEVKARERASFISTINPIQTTLITEAELGKAACCNLAESFETTPAVDVAFSDAVTGTRQIQMLGLAGIYSPVQVENIPYSRALGASNGLTFIPGPWIQSMQLSKGVGSVVNGFENFSGLLNVEMKKPEDEKLYINGYLNTFLRSEANLNFAFRVDSNWSTATLLHVDGWNKAFDQNKDGFMEMPLSEDYAITHRWSFQNKKGLEGQYGFKALYDRRWGGQLDYNPTNDRFSTTRWGFDMLTNRAEVFAKTGYVFPKRPQSSIGTIVNGVWHRQNNVFGLRAINMEQFSGYVNIIYSDDFNDCSHKYKTGVSFVYDNITDKYIGNVFNRNEAIPGAFFEYTYNPTEHLTLLAGLRGDWHNNYGFFATPRLHVKYEPVEGLYIRAVGGRAQRTPNLFADNLSLFASSRAWNFFPQNNLTPYGLKAEVAWNYGANLTYTFEINELEAVLSADFYRTDFVNQLVVDMETFGVVSFYNLQGQSYANSSQIQFDFQPIERLEIRLAYRFLDVKQTLSGELREKPFVAMHRGFANIGYATKNKFWKFDATLNYNGSKRLPSSAIAGEALSITSQSPNFFILNAQVTRQLNRWEVYVGGENLLNTTQSRLIVDPANPFGNNFDATLVWGPTMGAMAYIGFRFKIEQKP